jgi:hypothetical protein
MVTPIVIEIVPPWMKQPPRPTLAPPAERT